MISRIAAAVLAVAALCVPAALAGAQSFSQAYDASEGVQKGMIVMLDKKDPKRVLPLTNKNDADMLGVIVSANDTTVPLANVLAWAEPQELPVVVVPGADHFFHGRLHTIRDIVGRYLPPLIECRR